MKIIKVFQPRMLTKDETLYLEGVMLAAKQSLAKAAKELHDNDSPSVIRGLRDAYKAEPDTLTNYPEAAAAVRKLRSLEQEIISAFIASVAKMVNHIYYATHRRTGMVEAEYFQEAAFAIYDASYYYNGENRFSTFVYGCVKNRLLAITRRKRQELSSLTDDYVARPNNTEEQQINHQRLDRMQRALQTTQLSPVEKRILEEYLGGKSQSEIARHLVNPRTGSLYTKQALNQTIDRIKNKLRATIESKAA